MQSCIREKMREAQLEVTSFGHWSVSTLGGKCSIASSDLYRETRATSPGNFRSGPLHISQQDNMTSGVGRDSREE